MPGTAVDLTVPSLADLHRRRSEKWALHDEDVLSLTVAEMDFPIAHPIREALFAAIDRNDLGYALARTPTLTGALVGFVGRRLDWAVDPEQVTVVPDVMVGLIELCRAIAAPGQALPSPRRPIRRSLPNSERRGFESSQSIWIRREGSTSGRSTGFCRGVWRRSC